MNYEPQDIYSFIQNVKSARSYHEQLWTQAINFYRGNQWFSSVNAEVTNSVLPTNRTPLDKIRPVINRCQPAVEFLTSTLLARRMIANSLPASEGDKDILHAEFASKYLRYLLDNENWVAKDERGLKNMLICGNVAFHVRWDPTKGRKTFSYERANGGSTAYTYNCAACGFAGTGAEENEYPVYGGPRQTREMKCDQCGAPVQGQPRELRYAHEGDVAIEVLPIQNFFPEANVIDLADCRRAAHVVYMDLDVLRECYPQADFNHIQARASEYTRSPTNEMGDHNNRVDVFTFYELPSARNPEGVLRVCTKEIELYKGPFPYDDGDNGPTLPYADGRCILAPDDYYAFGMTVNAHSTQQVLNQFWRNYLVHFRDFFDPKWLAALGSVSEKELAPGNRVVFYKNGQKPDRSAPPELSNQVFAMGDKIAAELNSELGYDEVLQGGAASNTESGRQLALRQEKAMSPRGSVADRWNETFRRVCWLALSRVKQFYTEDRLVRIAGEDGEVESLVFKKYFVPSNHDIRVTTEMPLGGNRQENFEKVKELQQVNFFAPDMPPALFKKLSEMIDMPELRVFTKLDRLARNLARKENIDMQEGQPARATLEDDHDTHLMIHREAQQTVSGRDNVLITQHVQEHEVLARVFELRKQSFNQMAQEWALANGVLPQPPQPAALGQPPAQGQAQEQLPNPTPVNGPLTSNPTVPAEAAVKQADATAEQAARNQLGAMMMGPQ